MSGQQVRRRAQDDREDRQGGVGGVKSIAKSLAVLEAFLGRGRNLSLGEIARITDLDKSAVQRITRTLLNAGYLDQDRASRRYSLGTHVLDLSYAFLSAHPLIERAVPVLVDLLRDLRERVDLTVLDGDTVVYVLRMQAKREIFRPALVGRRVPVFCHAAGRAALSRLEEDEARRIIENSDRRAYTPHTKTDPEEILTDVRKARRQGYSIQSEEWLPAEIVGAVPITDQEGKPIAAICVASSTRDWTPSDFERHVAAALLTAGAELSR